MFNVSSFLVAVKVNWLRRINGPQSSLIFFFFFFKEYVPRVCKLKKIWVNVQIF